MTMPMRWIQAMTLGVFFLFAAYAESTTEASSLLAYLHAQSTGFFQPSIKQYERSDPQYAMKLKMLGG